VVSVVECAIGSAVQKEPESVVVEDPLSLDFLDLQVRGLGRSVGDAAGVEAGQQFLRPGVDRSGEAVQFGDVGVGAA
jgi:hypothetical protein